MLLYYLRHFLKPEIYGKGYAGMFKQGFYEAPWITVSMILTPIPFLFTPYVIWRYEKMDGAGKRFVHRFTVFRPGHPHLKYFTHLNDRTKVSKPQ